ncbi:MAG: T9SS type A sorting domain-containing protein [Bacteroidota bacterium]
MNTKILLSLVTIWLLCLTSLSAQGLISIDHKTQRFLGDVSSFDRSKYLNGHFVFNSPDSDFASFKSTYKIDSTYIGSRQFWSPMNKVNNGQIPNIQNQYDSIRIVNKGLVATGRASRLMYDGSVDYSTVDVSAFSQQFATYIAQSYRDEWNPMQEYIEPFNEPMVHAKDYYPGNWNKAKNDSIITHMCLFHRDLGQAIHALPELANLKMMGYASAFPEFEQNNFDFWRARYKKFIDIAGADVDVFSVHLYDGSGLNNSGGRRSGSNVEAIMDMVEAYSFVSLGTVKPLAITEYGRLVLSQPGWPGNGISNYEPIENSQAVRSQLHMVMGFMERGDNIALTIPFSVGKSDPLTDKFSRAALFVEQTNGSYSLTERRFFYEMWKEVRGERVWIHSTNVDVQTQAFVDGDKLYVVLNNLNDNAQQLSLDLKDSQEVVEVRSKRLKIFADRVPELTQDTLGNAPTSINLAYGETLVLTYTFSSPVVFDNEVRATKYYATTYLEPIVAGTDASFTFDNLTIGDHGLATLRIGIGREHGKSLRPSVQVNGQALPVKGDIIRGYDQQNRNQFFGLLEIPVPLDMLNAGSNQVKLQFGDSGGHISSAILQVQNATESVPLSVALPKDDAIRLYPNPVHDYLQIKGLAPKAEVSIYDLRGRLIQAGLSTETGVDVRVLPVGTYLLRFEQGAIKFVKE